MKSKNNKIKKRKLSKKRPEKHLTVNLKKHAGRSNSGKITIRHRGGGVKRLYRIVDFGQKRKDLKGEVIAVEYDPNRTAYLALIKYENGEKRYILAPAGIEVGDTIICSDKAEIKPGNRMKLKNVISGTQVYNVALNPEGEGKMIRSAGTSAKVMSSEGKYTILKMASGEIRKVLSECFASVGQVSHPEKKFEKIKNAGAKRRKGWRPSVRGKAMNTVDHPHGGGTGRTSIGMKHPKTPWGKNAYGVKTRRKNKPSNKLIIKRKK